MSARRLRRIAVVVLALILLGGFFAFRLTRHSENPSTNLPYVAWKLGLGGFSPDFAWMIKQDNVYWQRFMGKPIAYLQEQTGVPFHDGRAFPLSSYRGKYWYYNHLKNPDTDYYFFDDNHRAYGWCVLVTDGKVSGFALAKG